MKLPGTVFGVDFSGAKLAGKNTWIARVGITSGRARLESLDNLGRLTGTDERDAVMRKLVSLIAESRSCLWGMDFPFALPVELFPVAGFDEQLRQVAAFEGTAMEFGRECVRRCQAALGRMHVRRTTDTESRTPFDCYHYRIIHQTFHGMREVLLPLRGVNGTAVLPFDPSAGAERWVAESCPSSTIKRWGLPHANYKQTDSGPLTARRRAVRKVLFGGVYQKIAVAPRERNLIARNPGGDAMDAVIAALGAMEGLARYNEAAVSAHPRYRREGLVFY